MIKQAIEGERVVLKRPSREDLSLVREIWEDGDTMSDVGGVVAMTQAEYDAWYEAVAANDPRHGYYLVFDRLDGRLVGEVGWHRFDPGKGRADFNVKILDRLRGKGYSTEACELLLEEYFLVTHATCIKDPVAPSNDRGVSVLERFGFRELGLVDGERLLELSRERFEGRLAFRSLAPFLIEAKASTYASGGSTITPTRPGSKDYLYEKGDFAYRDSYFGSRDFTGQEIVYFRGTPLWTMNYLGKTLWSPLGESYIACLRGALASAPLDSPYRGPARFSLAPYEYSRSLNGGLRRFSGKETITREGKTVYELTFEGGAID